MEFGLSVNPQQSFIYGGGRSIVLRHDSTMSEDHALLADPMGSVTGLVGSMGLVETYEYDAYGQVTFADELGVPYKANAQASRYGNDILYAGYLYESEVAHYWLQFRVYDPHSGRFLTIDPIGVWGDTANWGNGYGYGGANPVNSIDPTGLIGPLATGAIGAVVGGAIRLGVNLFSGSENVWEGVGEAAAVGFVAGATFGLVAPALTAAGAAYVGGTTGTIAAGAAGGAISGLAANGFEAAVLDREFEPATAMAVGAAFGVAAEVGGLAIRASWSRMSTSTEISTASSLEISLNGQPKLTASTHAVTERVRPGSRIDISEADAVAKKVSVPKGEVLCFPPGTLVLMADGSTKAIEDVVPGDEVLADEPEDDDRAEPRKVVRLVENWAERLFTIYLDEDGDGESDGNFQATGEHPIWTQNRGWRFAEHLKAGDRLLDANQRVVHVLGAIEEKVESKTYNLTVEGTHTFFVVADGISVLVHNTGEDDAAHRGRVQAQGAGVEKSVPWSRSTPPTVSEGQGMIDDLESQLSRSERRARQQGLDEARRFVDRAGAAGGVDAPVSESFPRRGSGDVRVDIEVKTGRAFVPDPCP